MAMPRQKPMNCAEGLKVLMMSFCSVIFLLVCGPDGMCQDKPSRNPDRYGITPVIIFNQHFYSGRFNSPTGIFGDPRSGEIYVADTANNLIGIFDHRGFNIFSFGDNEYVKSPIKVVTDAKGQIYVLGGDRKKIRIFNYRGDYLKDLELAELFNKTIATMAMDFKGNFYIGLQETAEILVYDADFTLQLRFGGRGKGAGQFQSIAGIASDKDGNIYIVDQVGIPVQVFNKRGQYLRSWGSHAMGDDNFSLPQGVVVDSRGRVIIVDALRQEIKVFTADGNFLVRFGGLGADPGQVYFPADISIDESDRIYIVEKLGNRAQVFEEGERGK